MPKLECALAESQIRPFAEQPVLSIVIPTYERPAELQLTVQSIADQLKDGLEDKVELLISDNNSGPDTNGMIRALADRYPRLGYMVNARDEGGFFNLFAAPWRAQGRYTWAFGSDDVLLDGGVGSVVQILEREAPSFLTLNKRAANADLTQVLYTSLNNVPDKRFDSFIDLFCAFGINQLAFISAQIENTEAARKLTRSPICAPTPVTRTLSPIWKSTLTPRPITARPITWCTGSRTPRPSTTTPAISSTTPATCRAC
jgi:hypothetical protein